MGPYWSKPSQVAETIRTSRSCVPELATTTKLTAIYFARVGIRGKLFRHRFMSVLSGRQDGRLHSHFGFDSEEHLDVAGFGARKLLFQIN